LVSIVIPLYNGERYIGATLTSILEQTYEDIEIVVVNDGSTDRSIDICRQFKDPRIRYLEQANSGLAATRNLGIRHSRGKYLGFIDADDLWFPKKVARHVERFEADPDLGLSYSYSSLINEAGEDLGTFQKEGTDPTTFIDCYIRNVIGNGSNAMIRREVFTGRSSDPEAFPPIHSFDPELHRAEDYELWSRITYCTRWKVACIPEALVKYRINLTGLSSNTRLQRHYHLFPHQYEGRRPKLPLSLQSKRRSIDPVRLHTSTGTKPEPMPNARPLSSESDRYGMPCIMIYARC